MKSSMLLPIFDLIKKSREKKRKKSRKRESKIQEDTHEESPKIFQVGGEGSK
jgi:hypothetical protein